MTTPSPLEDEELFTALAFGGVRSPGVVSFSGHDRDVGWDVKKGKGQSGATIERTSEDPIPFTAEFYLADKADIEAWPPFLALLKSTLTGSDPQARDVYHPDLAEVDIKSVVVAKFYGTRHDGKGGQYKKVGFLEYRPPKKAGGSPKGSKATKPKATDPNAAANAELARLIDEYKSPPRQLGGGQELLA